MLRVAPHEEHLTYLLTRAGFCDEDSNPLMVVEVRASGDVERFADESGVKLSGGIAEATVRIDQTLSAREIRQALWDGVEQAAELVKDKLSEGQRDDLSRIEKQYLSVKWGWSPLLPRVYGVGITMAVVRSLLWLVPRGRDD